MERREVPMKQMELVPPPIRRGENKGRNGWNKENNETMECQKRGMN
jgi:hypothetical protein